MTAPPTQTQRDAYEDAASEFEGVHATLRELLEQDVEALLRKLDEAGVLWTPGRMPRPQATRKNISSYSEVNECTR